MIKLNGKEVLFESFPNGETKMIHEGLIIKDVSHVDFKYEDDSDLIKLMFVSEYIYPKTLKTNLRIQYMPYSRMDRSENDSPFTLKYIAKFINMLDFNKVELIEPHSNVTVRLIDNAEENYINFELIEKVKDEVGFDRELDYIMFPDEGAKIRYYGMLANNVLIGEKVRDFETGRIKSLELVGDTSKAQGRKAIIVDDLSSYGGTFVKSATALKEAGISEVYLLVAHAENSVFKGDLFNHIDKLFTTDSILTEQDNWENTKFKEKLKIYNIEGVLSND